MSAYQDLLATGNGRLSFALVIEGWPHIFVTDPSITLEDVADGRTVTPALSYSGLRISDRIILTEARIEADGMTFRLVPPTGTLGPAGGTDPVTASVSRYPSPIGSLASPGLEEDDTAITFSPKPANLFVDGGVYYLGTETVRYTEGEETNTLERAIWDSQPQSHHATVVDRSRTVFIYDKPPTMEGRRAYLYLYVNGEGVSDYGQPIWRGIVNRPPRLASDGASWMIEALPITHLLRQKVAGGIGSARPLGLYHHSRACFAFQLTYVSDTSTWTTEKGAIFKYTGIDTQETLKSEIDALLESALQAIGADTYFSARLICNAGVWSFMVRRNDTAGSVNLGIAGGSHICGFNYTQSLPNANLFVASATLDHPYYQQLTQDPSWSRVSGGNGYSYSGEPASPLGDAAALFREDRGDGMSPTFFTDDTADAAFPMFRVHLDQELVNIDDAAVQIDPYIGFGNQWIVAATGTAPLTVGGVSANAFYVDLARNDAAQLQPPHYKFGDPGIYQSGPALGYWGTLTKEVTISVVRQPVAGDVGDYVTALKANAVDANDGNTPFITGEDLAEWDIGDVFFYDREYAFNKAIALEDILCEELKLATYFMRLEADGRIGIVEMFGVTDAIPVDSSHDITPSEIIAPTGEYGSFPGVEPQRDGIVTQVSIQQFYQPATDDWGDQPSIIVNDDVLATHKGRGKQTVEIKTYSRPLTDDLAELSNPTTGYRFLHVLGRDYVVVTVEVPFKQLEVLCGDPVRLTYRLVPDGSGNRGVVQRVCMCIGREWNLNPSPDDPMHGRLTLMMGADPVYGYAPAALITGIATPGGILTLTCDPAEDFNIQISTNGDGKCLLHFHEGDFIRIVEWDTDTPTIVTGQVLSEPDADAGTIEIALDEGWSTGSSTWMLEAQEDDGSTATAAQRKYQYEADADGIKPDGRFAGKFS